MKLAPLLRRAAAASIFCTGALLACQIHSPVPRPPPRNVVLISLDTLRADRMSLYGGPRSNTPEIGKLARRGVTFAAARSPAPWTLPAHAAMLTGRYPARLSDESSAQVPLYRLAPMLSSILQAQGFMTAAVTGGGFVSKALGADVGFGNFRHGGINRAVRFIRKRAREPFFLFFHTFKAHLPYMDFRYVKGLDGGRLAVLRDGTRRERTAEGTALTCGSTEYTAEEKEFARALYDGGVAAVDEQVGEIVAALEERKLLDSTIVIVTSDHGEEFWDHTDRGAVHGHTLYRELLRVPLVWYEPGLPEPGHTTDELVSLVDIVPTVLARLGLPPLSGVDGIDLSKALAGDRLGIKRELFAASVRTGPPREAMITSAGKLVRNGDPTDQRGEGHACPVPIAAARELYLPGDAHEQDNRVDALVRLTTKLDGRLSAAARAYAADAAQIPKNQPAKLDEGTRQRLKELGYIR